MFGKLSKGIKNSLKKVRIQELTEKDLEPLIQIIKDQMIRNEVAVDTADAIADQLKLELTNLEHTRLKSAQPLVEEALRIAVIKILSKRSDNYVNILDQAKVAKAENRPFILCILGINGTGKTTTIAKLAHLFKKEGYSVVLAAGDTYRAGAIEQLGNHAAKLKVNMISQQKGADPGAVAIDAIFVGDSLAGNDVIRQVKQFEEEVGIDGIIMTKLDSDAKGGSVLSVAHTSTKPILFFGTGQKYEDLIPFNPEFISKQIVPK